MLNVECYSGYTASERPVRFRSRSERSRTFEVVEILEQWYGPDYRCFRVRADDGNVYIFRHTGREDEWTLDSFHRSRP